MDVDTARAAQRAAYKVMNASTGHLAQFEEALRTVYADPRKLADILQDWPTNIAGYVGNLPPTRERIALHSARCQGQPIA